jgi:hypothetical protein
MIKDILGSHIDTIHLGYNDITSHWLNPSGWARSGNSIYREQSLDYKKMGITVLRKPNQGMKNVPFYQYQFGGQFFRNRPFTIWSWIESCPGFSVARLDYALDYLGEYYPKPKIPGIGSVWDSHGQPTGWSIWSRSYCLRNYNKTFDPHLKRFEINDYYDLSYDEIVIRLESQVNSRVINKGGGSRDVHIASKIALNRLKKVDERFVKYPVPSQKNRSSTVTGRIEYWTRIIEEAEKRIEEIKKNDSFK